VILFAAFGASCQDLDALDRCAVASCDAGSLRDSAASDSARREDARDAAKDARDAAKDASGGYPSQVLASTPLAYYRLDEKSGTIAHDASGHGHDCTYAAGVILGVPGALVDDTAVRIPKDGTGVYCAASLFAFTGTESFSVEGFYAPDGVDDVNYQSVFSRMEGSPRTGYYVYLHAQPDPGVNFEVWGSGSVACGSAGAGFPCSGAADGGFTCGGRFVHVVATYDGSTLSVYVDGARASTGSCSGIPDPGAVDFTMGNFSGLLCPTCAMVGAIDEVAVYDRALSVEEVRRHWQASGL
jgi:hypothetical protein